MAEKLKKGSEMDIKSIENISNNQTTKNPDQNSNTPFTNEIDDISPKYIQSRKIAHEYYSPAVQNIINISENENEDNQESDTWWPFGTTNGFINKKLKEGKGTAQIKGQKEKEGVVSGKTEEPWIDPTMAFSGGFGATGKMAFSQGMKLMPTLVKAITSGTIGALTDIPIGAVTEKVGEDYPKLALPFNVLTGMVSGITLEKTIEKGVIKGFQKAGAVTENIPDMVKTVTQDMYKKLSNERGSIDFGKTPMEKEVVAAINEDFKGLDNPILEDLLPAKKPIETLPETKTRKMLVAIGAKPETSIKSSLWNPDLDDLELKDKAININFSKIESEDDIKKVIQKTSETYFDEIQSARRDVRSNEQTAKAANLLGMTPEELLRRRKGQTFNAEEALAARRVLVSSAENIQSLAQKVQTLDATDIDRFEFRKALNLHYAIQSQVSGMTAEAGRALQSFNILAKSSQAKTAQIKDLLSNLPDGVSIEKMAQSIASIDSVEGMNKAIPKMIRATTKDMFIEAWINGLLSGPQTHAVNTLSNSLNAFWQIPERFLASQIGKVLPGEQAIKEREALYQAYGLITGFKDGLKAFTKVAKTGVPTDAMSKLEAFKYRAITANNVRELPLVKKLAPDALQEGSTAAHAVDLLGEGIRLPGRFLMAEDELFKSVGYRMELNALAYRTAMQEGLEGESAARRMSQILSDPEIYAPDIHLSAINASRYQTFTGALGSKILNAISQSKNPIIKLVAPFVRTPTNILKYGFDRTPLAFLSKNIRADMQAGGARRDLALSRISLGSMIMTVTGVMAAQGMITGNGPADPKLRANLQRQGWQPNSIKIGDTYIQYGRMEPLGILMGLSADYAEMSGMAGEEFAPEMDKLASAITMSISKNVTSKTWLKGITDIIEAIDDPDRYGNQYIQGLAKSLVPSIVAQTERTLDPEQQSVNGMMDAMKSRIPGLSDSLPTKRNIWGEPITFQYGKGGFIEKSYSFLSPIYLSESKNSPIDKELTKMKLGLTMPDRTQNILGVGIELKPQEYDDFMVLMNSEPIVGNMNLKEYLDFMVTKSPEYKQATDDEKEEIIKTIYTKAKAKGKEKIIAKYPELEYVAQEWNNRKQMGNLTEGE